MQNKLYLDTTIPSAYFDTSKPVRQLITQKWFENDSDHFTLYISVITIMEIEKIKNKIKKENIKKLILDHNIIILDFDDQAKELANQYMQQGAIPKSEPEDAYHIAIATINQIDLLA